MPCFYFLLQQFAELKKEDIAHIIIHLVVQNIFIHALLIKSMLPFRIQFFSFNIQICLSSLVVYNSRYCFGQVY